MKRAESRLYSSGKAMCVCHLKCVGFRGSGFEVPDSGFSLKGVPHEVHVVGRDDHLVRMHRLQVQHYPVPTSRSRVWNFGSGVGGSGLGGGSWRLRLRM